MELDLWLGDRLVARTESRDRGARVRITYTDEIAAELGPEVPLLSCALPTPGPSRPAAAWAFLEGLLPEGRALEAAAATVRGVRLRGGAPESPADAVLLLAEFGRECAGAIVALPAGSPDPSAGRYADLDEDGLAELVRGLPEHPLGVDLSRDIRMSLAGAQPKLLLARVAGHWAEPLAGAASTHILKPATTWPHSAHNEALVMTLARSVGLTDHAVWVEDVRGTGVLVAERYDREWHNGHVIRRHQEDMCQATGLRPVEKYRIGRPSDRMAGLLRQFAASPRTELEKLLRQLAFRVLVGDADGHGKNYSVLLSDGAVTLAPMYDSLCTLAYPELSDRMAAPVGAHHSLADVDRAALVAEAGAMGIPQAEAETLLGDLAGAVRAALDTLDPGLAAGWPCEPVLDTITARLDRFDAGEPLGFAQAGTGHTFDQATLYRQSAAPPDVRS